MNAEIVECFAETVRKYPDKTALVDKGNSISWEQLDEKTEYLADFFKSIGVGSGTHTGICCGSNFQWVCSFLALQKTGAVAVLINPRCTIKEIEQQVQIGDVDFLCCDDRVKEEICDNICGFRYVVQEGKESNVCMNGFPGLHLLQKHGTGEDRQQSRRVLHKFQPGVCSPYTACMVFTSGSVARPKAVMLAHDSLVESARAFNKAMGWTIADRVCLAAPLHHVMGVVNGLLGAMCCGHTVVLAEDMAAVMKLIKYHHCTAVIGTPPMFLALANCIRLSGDKISSLKSGFVAGSPMMGKQFTEIRQVLGLENFQIGYGMTEASGGISCTDYGGETVPVADSVGKVSDGIEIKIEGQGSTDGEILVRGFCVMQGYYKEPEETAGAIDGEGWLHTGDMGYLGENGVLCFTGRRKEIIICNGENISPREIEEQIISYPGIAEAKVFGIQADDVREEAAACVRMAEGEEFNEKGLRQYLVGRIAYYKMPKYIVLLESFPVNANGKIDRKRLVETVVRKIGLYQIAKKDL